MGGQQERLKLERSAGDVAYDRSGREKEPVTL
jgi:hypothetical protein